MRRTYIAPISFGLGDLIVSLPAIQASITESQNGETWLVARSAGQAALAGRIAGLAGCVHEDAFDPARAGGRFFDLRDHPLQRDYWWGSPEFDRAIGPLTINEILERICSDFGIAADFSRPAPLDAPRARDEVRDSVLLVTESDGTKRWAPERWAELAREIRDGGDDVRMVTREEPVAEMSGLGIDAVRAPTPGDTVDLLTSCRAVVGIDTGLTHIAVQQGTPTVGIYRDRAVYFRPWPHTRAVVGDRCDESCRSIERTYAYNAQVRSPASSWQPRSCPVGARCLQNIRPADVMDALRELL
ncbi:MAG TPA: glycosyltransferase family 9 protein [Acidimicrobiia bacterium]